MLEVATGLVVGVGVVSWATECWARSRFVEAEAPSLAGAGRRGETFSGTGVRGDDALKIRRVIRATSARDEHDGTYLKAGTANSLAFAGVLMLASVLPGASTETFILLSFVTALQLSS